MTPGEQMKTAWLQRNERNESNQSNQRNQLLSCSVAQLLKPNSAESNQLLNSLRPKLSLALQKIPGITPFGHLH